MISNYIAQGIVAIVLLLLLFHSGTAESSSNTAAECIAGLLAVAFLVVKTIERGTKRKKAREARQDTLHERDPQDPAWSVDQAISDIPISAFPTTDPDSSLHALRTMQLELLDLRRQHQLLVERAVDVICVIDTNATIRSINRASERAWGYKSRELNGKSLELILPADDVDRLKKTVLGKVRSIDRVNLETRVKRADGTELDVVWTGYWSARESGLFCIVHDISEQKQMAKMKDDFFAMISHDLKNPLTSVMGLLTLMEQGVFGTITEHGKKVAAGAHAECGSMLRLLDDYLQIEKAEAGMFKLEPGQFDMRKTIENTISTLEAQARAKSLNMVVECNNIGCFADEQRIMQVLTNLISNAIKFAPESSTVKVVAQAKPDEVMVSVEDQGKGIPLEKQAGLFEKFRQVDPTDSTKLGGTGLGLAICKMIVTQHGGRIGVDTDIGKGSRFWFSIPNVQG